MSYDLAIIGAGWAGFNAAMRAKSLGLKTALIEESFIGGTCLNSGCIPTKIFVQSAKILEEARKAKLFGVEINTLPELNFPAVLARKERIIQTLRQGMESRLSGIDFLKGHAEIIDNQRIKIADSQIEAKYILLSCGSRVFELPGFAFDGRKIISSEHILNLEKIPASLLIIGGGVIGCEFAQVFSSLGAKVTIVEIAEQLLPGVDKEIAKKLEIVFKKKKISVNTRTDARTFDLNNFEKVLVSVGRKANIAGLEKLGIETGKTGIKTDEYLRSSIPNIYAAGDCTGKLMLAHFASYQGIRAVENIAFPEKAQKADNAVVPGCIFTAPEIGVIGLNEEQAKLTAGEIKINKFDFLGSGMARIQDETEGFIKVISDAKTGKILGAHLIGPKATELVSVFGVAISSGLSVEMLKKVIFAHPTLSEAISEALE